MLRQARFTLIEVLVVISIILVLAGLTLAVAPYVQKSVRTSRTKSQIAQLVLAFEQYYDSWGYYPQQPTRAIVTATFLSSLRPQDSAGDTQQVKIYLSQENFGVDRSDISSVGLPRLVDAWSKPFWYQSPGTVSPTSFDLWSTGADGKHGKDATATPADAQVIDQATNDCDDIGSWKLRD